MTKSELIDAIAARGDLTKARAELVVNCLFDAMTEALQRGEGIEIRGFGSFTVRPYKPYSGRNPRTGQPVPVPAKRLPFFKVGKELKEIVKCKSTPRHHRRRRHRRLTSQDRARRQATRGRARLGHQVEILGLRPNDRLGRLHNHACRRANAPCDRDAAQCPLAKHADLHG